MGFHEAQGAIEGAFRLGPRLWSVSHRHGCVTTADFVGDRYGSRRLSLTIAVTGILATMPYVALIAFVKDTLIYLVIIVAVIYIPPATQCGLLGGQVRGAHVRPDDGALKTPVGADSTIKGDYFVDEGDPRVVKIVAWPHEYSPSP